MSTSDYRRLAISPETTIREAMHRLDQTAEKCLFVIDTADRLIGALTDGDVRRAILSGTELDTPIHGAYNDKPRSVAGGSTDEAHRLMRDHKIEVVPTVDDEHRYTGYITWSDLFGDAPRYTNALKGIPVVIMAGGFGTRLEPFTKVLPKPLIPIHDKTIIEHIIDRFVDTGVNDFWLTVNYKSRIIKAYFQDRDPDYTVHYIEEPEPMGTAGSLQFIRGAVDGPFFVTNCDIIINADYTEVLEFHRQHGHAITLVGSTLHYQIPYGTCILNTEGALDRIEEKPRYDFLANTGMYVVSPGVLEYIVDNGIYHMTDLIEDAIRGGDTVGVFPVSQDAWIDIGQWKEYQNALERL